MTLRTTLESARYSLPLSMGSPLGSPKDVAATGRAVRDMFASVAPRYDLLNHLLSFGCDIAWRRGTARELRQTLARPDSVALDVCCGTGDLALALACVSNGRVMGADFCHPMVQRANRKLRSLAARDTSRMASRLVMFMEADALALPFGGDSLDVVTAAFGFRNLASYERGLQELRRVLKPGGTLAILEFSQVRWPVAGTLFRFYFRRILPRIGAWVSGVEGPYQYLPDSVAKFPDQEGLVAAMRAAGFTNVRYRNFFGGVAALHLGMKA